MKVTNGNTFAQLASKPAAISGAEILSKLEVFDYGPQDMIEGMLTQPLTRM